MEKYYINIKNNPNVFLNGRGGLNRWDKNKKMVEDEL